MGPAPNLWRSNTPYPRTEVARTKKNVEFLAHRFGHRRGVSLVSKIDVFNILELERQASYFVTGGLAAVHARGRNRAAIWKALKNKEVYGTTGQRMLLWFDLLPDSTSGESSVLPMGSETSMMTTPRFRARAIGAFRQIPGCPDYSVNALAPERL